MLIEVLQSCAELDRRPWLRRCRDSVRAWAEGAGFAYRHEGDALFERLSPELRSACRGDAVIASDLGRLAWMRERLDAGVEAVVWLDADTLVLSPSRLELPAEAWSLGREVWVQRQARGLRAWRPVHNAWLSFRAGNPFLAYYAAAAERTLLRHDGRHRVPQLIGPKLLTAIHNAAPGPVNERAGVLSPAVIADLVRGDGPALRLFRRRSSEPPACVNLCASSVRRGELDDSDMSGLIERLEGDPALLGPS